MVTKEEYIEGIKWRYNSIKNEIADLQNKIQELFVEVERKQTQVQNLINLLKSEGEGIDTSERGALSSGAIAEIVYQFMVEENSRQPMHYTDITQKIMSQGILIPGKNPASNLLSNINRDTRFVRTAPGTYGLAEWGLKPVQSKKRKSRIKKS